VLVLVIHTYFCALADYDFSKTFRLQGTLAKILILIPAWTILPKIEQTLSPQIMSLQGALPICKIHHITFAGVSTVHWLNVIFAMKIFHISIIEQTDVTQM